MCFSKELSAKDWLRLSRVSEDMRKCGEAQLKRKGIDNVEAIKRLRINMRNSKIFMFDFLLDFYVNYNVV